MRHRVGAASERAVASKSKSIALHLRDLQDETLLGIQEPKRSSKPTAPGWAEQESQAGRAAGSDRSSGGTVLIPRQGSQAWPLISSFNRLVPCMDETMALQWELTSILNFRSQAHLVSSAHGDAAESIQAGRARYLHRVAHDHAALRRADASARLEQSPVAIYFAVSNERAGQPVVFETQRSSTKWRSVRQEAR